MLVKKADRRTIIPANSRRTFNMAEHSGINGRAAIMVTSKTSGKKIMVEGAPCTGTTGARARTQSGGKGTRGLP